MDKLEKPQALAAFIVREIYASGFGYVDDPPEYLRKDGETWVVDEELYKKQ